MTNGFKRLPVPPTTGVRARGRRGGVYVLVLIVTTIVSAMGLLGLSVARSQESSGRRISGAIEARQLAASAMDVGLHILADEPNWRLTRSPGEWLAGLQVGEGSFTLSVAAAGGGAYGKDAAEPIEMTGYGYRGSSRVILRARAELRMSDLASHVPALFAAKPVGYWPLGGAASPGFEEDLVDRNDADPAWSGEEIVPGAVPGLGSETAAWFDGLGWAVEIDSVPAYSQVRTVSVWFWAEEQTGLVGIASRDASGRGSGGRWEIGLYNGTLQAVFDTNVRTVSLEMAGVPMRRWNHAAMVVDNAGMRLYLNGALVDQWNSGAFAGELAACNPSERLYLGVSRLGSSSGSGSWSGQFRGSICEFALLATPLSTAEIAALYAAYAPPASYTIVTDSWARVIE